MRYKLKYISIILFLCLFCNGCGIYTFQQGSIPPEVQTLSIANIINEAAGPAYLSQVFTEKLKSYYQQNSRLSIVNSAGDWQIEGRIVSYQIEGIVPQAGDQSEMNRLTIRVNIKFTDTNNEKANFDQSFSYFRDYPKSTTLSTVERELIEFISDQIVLDIFNKTTSNW